MADTKNNPASRGTGGRSGEEESGPRGRWMLAGLVAGLAAVGAVYVATKEEPRPVPSAPPPPPPPPVVQASPSEHPLCKNLQELMVRARADRNCKNDDWFAAKAICEVPYETKAGCLPALSTMMECLKAKGSEAWTCDANGTLEMDPTPCKEAVDAFGKCLNG